MAVNTNYGAMENKQHSTRILPESSFQNEFAEFIEDKTEETGEYIVENAVNEMSAQGADTSILVDGEVPDIAEISYSTRRSENYIYKIREDELKKASASKEAYNELRSRIDANLDEQDRKNCWRQFPKVISNTTGMKKTQLIYNTDENKFDDIVLAMREDVRKIHTPSDLYNSYTKSINKMVGGKKQVVTQTLKTFANEVVIFVLASLKDKLEVKFKSGVYNLDEVTVGARIIPVNTFYKWDGSKYVEDPSKLWVACGRGFAKIYKDFEKRARLEDLRGYNIGKAVTYIEYTSKLVPAIVHFTGTEPV